MKTFLALLGIHAASEGGGNENIRLWIFIMIAAIAAVVVVAIAVSWIKDRNGKSGD
jgi:hypothetical protein